MRKRIFKSKALGAVLLSLGLFQFSGTMAEDVVSVVRSTGAVDVYPMAPSGKLYFEEDELVVLPAVGEETTRIDLADVKRLLFRRATGVDEVLAEDLSVFPNPTADNVYISSANEADNVEVYAWNGMLLSVQPYSVSEGVSLREMPKGLYVIRLNGSTYKVAKK